MPGARRARGARASVQGGEAGAVGDKEQAGAGGGDEVEEERHTASPVASSRLPVGSSARMRPGRAGERAADGDALLLAAGELLGVAGEEVGEAEAAR